MIFDEDNDYVILPAYDFITWYDPGQTILIAQFQATNIREMASETGEIAMVCYRAADDIIGTYDKKDFQTITFPASDTSLAIGYSYVDESGNPTILSFFGSGMRNIRLSRTK